MSADLCLAGGGCPIQIWDYPYRLWLSHEGDSYLGTSLRRRSAEKLQQALAYYEPSTYLPRVSCPALRTGSPTDTSACEQKSAGHAGARLPVDPSDGCMPNDPRSNPAFANSVLQGGAALPDRGDLVQEGDTWSGTCTAPYPLEQAELCYTKDRGISKDRKWHAVPASLGSGKVSAQLPAGTTAFFFNVTDAEGRMASSLSREL